jgi:hypothetical protein
MYSWKCRRFDERGETTTLTVERDGLFDVAVNKVLPEARLKPETVFKCAVSIPGTDFSIKEETLYFPGKGATQKFLVKRMTCFFPLNFCRKSD